VPVWNGMKPSYFSRPLDILIRCYIAGSAPELGGHGSGSKFSATLPRPAEGQKKFTGHSTQWDPLCPCLRFNGLAPLGIWGYGQTKQVQFKWWVGLWSFDKWNVAWLQTNMTFKHGLKWMEKLLNQKWLEI
jgi:hypothetical protein